MTSTEIGTLYEQYFRQLCLYALHYVGDLDESKDIVQECFASLIKNNPALSKSQGLSLQLCPEPLHRSVEVEEERTDRPYG